MTGTELAGVERKAWYQMHINPHIWDVVRAWRHTRKGWYLSGSSARLSLAYGTHISMLMAQKAALERRSRLQSLGQCSYHRHA
jgi:hypothetical protein